MKKEQKTQHREQSMEEFHKHIAKIEQLEDQYLSSGHDNPNYNSSEPLSEEELQWLEENVGPSRWEALHRIKKAYAQSFNPEVQERQRRILCAPFPDQDPLVEILQRCRATIPANADYVRIERDGCTIEAEKVKYEEK
ncbi:MAG: hypothetical protein ACMXYK_03835 [Candidatus Woesearchaeota archaeon]